MFVYDNLKIKNGFKFSNIIHYSACNYLKIFTRDNSLEQVSDIHYLSCDVFYEYSNDLLNQISKNQVVCGVLA